MKSSNYWRERTLQGKVQTLRQAEREIAALDRDLARAARELREAAGRILQTLQADPAAARRRLTDRQRTATLRDYYRLVERALGGDAHADALLDLAEKRRKITRLDALLLEVDGYTGKLYRSTQGRTERLLRLTADSAYYRQVFGFERGLGQYEFTRLNPSALEALLREDWSGRPWSDRLWGRVRDLDKRVKGAVRQGFLQGWGVRELQAELQVQTGQTRANVRRLARTEAAHAAEQAALLAYEDAGVARYEFSATLDAVTSPACRALDGKTFPVADARVGENYPPMHPNCRSTTLPVVDGVDETQEVRAVRDPITGARQTIPASWDYGKWYEERVRKGGKSDRIRTKASGAKKTLGWQDRHAERYYEEVRNRQAFADARQIAAHTPFKVEAVEEIRQHVFLRQHNLDGEWRRFDADYFQAQAWQRLVEGRNIRPSDVMLLRHEYVELTQMRTHGYDYETAHRVANQLHPWWAEVQREGKA